MRSYLRPPIKGCQLCQLFLTMASNFSGTPFEHPAVNFDHKFSPRQVNRFPQRLLLLSPQAATFNQRGLICDPQSGGLAVQPQKQIYLETIGQTFIYGYNAAIMAHSLADLFPLLEGVTLNLRGFAYEGAAMALSLLDCLTLGKRDRFEHFLANEGKKHIYMAYVGKGWQLARITFSLRFYLQKLADSAQHFPDSLLGWLALDGYGFHQGYFAGPKYIRERKSPQELSGYARLVFAQGLGRSLWFVKGANIPEIADQIQKFDPLLQPHLWSGIGLACTYAGGVSPEEIQHLKQLAEPYRAELAQGAAFAAKARLLAENCTENTEIACQILCGMAITETAKITDDTLIGLDYHDQIPAYEQWRQAIQSHFRT